MKHEMGLQNKWFDAIESGRKKFELRLFDDKRKQINVGDTIVFTSKDGRKLKREVVCIIREQTFMSLAARFPLVWNLASDDVTSDDMLKLMEEFYPVEKQEKLGVVAIGLQ